MSGTEKSMQVSMIPSKKRARTSKALCQDQSRLCWYAMYLYETCCSLLWGCVMAACRDSTVACNYFAFCDVHSRDYLRAEGLGRIW